VAFTGIRIPYKLIKKFEPWAFPGRVEEILGMT
jgi:hypothetical protein